jgi:acyl-CoA thioester hydrolase
MAMKQATPLMRFEATVLPEWIDSNGHMNLAYYVVVFDLATDLLFEHLGVGIPYRETTGNSCFTAETHTIYEREVTLGDRLFVNTRLLAADNKRLHYFHEMFHAEHRFRACVQELISLHVDMAIRRTAPFPAEQQATINAMLQSQAGVPFPPEAGRRITMPEGKQ